MQGVIAAVPTPVDASGKPRRAPFIDHCRWALDNGCDGLNVLGSTGEANSLGHADRRQVMGWAAEALDKSRLMVGTGTPALDETVALTEAADDLGFPVALVLPPYYYKPVSEEGLFAWFQRLHEALGRRGIEIWFYNYPQLTGITLPVSLVVRLAETFPDRFRGIKDSSGDLAYAGEIAARLKDFSVFPSSETALGEAARAGFAGCISATANISAPLCAELWAARAAVPEALLSQVGEIRSGVAAHPLIPAVKYMVARRTGDREWERPLPPFAPLTPQARLALDRLRVPATV